MSLGVHSGNPALAFDPFARYASVGQRSNVMTVAGTVGKTSLLLAILTATAGWTWSQMGNQGLSAGLLMGSAIGGVIVAMITIFRPSASPITAPIYAALEGIILGAISNLVERRYPGIAVQAVSLTFGTLAIMLFIYATRMIRVTERLWIGLTAATGAIALVYFTSWVLGFFGVAVPFLHSSSKLGIGFSLFVVGLAAFNLLLDFDIIERGARYEAPKFMEWYGAFSLMVTLIWLYMEILRLLSKLRERER